MNIYAFADEASTDIDGQIKALLRNNLQGLEIRTVDGINVSDISKEKASEVRKKLDENGLITWSVGSPIGKIDIEKDDFNSHSDKLRHTLEIANILETDKMRIFSFYIPKGKKPEDFRNCVLERMAEMIEIAKPYGVKLCHENEKGIYGDTAERCADLLKSLPELGGIFDPCNFIQCGQDTLKAWNSLCGRTDYLHIKDGKADGTVVPAGKGTGNIKYILDDYSKHGGISVTLEPHLAVFNGLGKLEREGETTKIDNYVYNSNDEAFDAATAALKALV